LATARAAAADFCFCFYFADLRADYTDFSKSHFAQSQKRLDNIHRF